MAKMSEREILSAIGKEEKTAYGYLTGELSEQRAEAMDYYLGKPFGNEIEDRSSVVSTDVADTIEWVKPSIMKIFTSADDVVSFTPRGPEDEQQAAQETDYVNYVVTQLNNWFEIFYIWITDALLLKNGYVKAVWEETKETSKEKYKGLTDDQLLMIIQDDDLEITAHSEEVEMETVTDPQTGQMMQVPNKTHDIEVTKTETCGQVRIYNIPPEEMLVSVSCTSVNPKKALFTQHRTWKTLSEIRAMGYDVPDDIQGDSDEINITNEQLSRQIYGEQTMEREQAADKSTRRVQFKETYLNIDVNGDGIAELVRVIHVGQKVLDQEEADYNPFSAITPIIMPHQHIGLSYADIIKDLQLIKSTILRQILDNMYFANNGRYAISDKVNLDDFLVSKPGGAVRIEDGALPSEGHIMPLPTPVFGQSAFSMLEYIDNLRENRTGVTKYNQGLDANSLNKTAQGINQIMTAAQQRIDLVARVFAETGVKDLFQTVHQIILMHEMKEQVVKLRNEWVTVDPREWKTRKNMTINVGLGTNNKDQMLGHLMSLLQTQMQVALPLGIANPQTVYNTLSKIAQNSGFKSTDEFFTAPQQQPQQQQPDPQTQALMQKNQLDAQKAQADVQLTGQKAQFDIILQREKIAADKETARYKIEMDAQLQRERMALEHDRAIMQKAKEGL